MAVFIHETQDRSTRTGGDRIGARNPSEPGEDSIGGAGPTGAGRPSGPLKKVKHDDIVFFANQLAVMVDAGVPLSEALDAIANSTDNNGLEAVVSDLSSQVKNGVEFSAAMENHRKHFSELFISLMRASEASGTMGTMLERCTDYMMQDRETRRQIKGAMIYPACMMSFCVLVVIGLLVFVLPRFEKIYAGKGALLPLPTRILLATSNGIVNYWPYILGGLGTVIGLSVMYFRSPSGRRAADKIKISLPILGPMFRKACMARGFRTMATMVATGVAMLDGLDITARISGNYYFARLWRKVAESVEEGAHLSLELFEDPLIPRTIAQMVDAGERTGKLDMVMDRVAKFCEDDLRIAVKTVTSMIEPIMIIFMGLIVGGIAMALLLPIFNMAKVMRGGH